MSADVPTLLILTDTLSRNLERGCAIVLDVSGIVYDSDREAIHAGRARRDLAQYQRAMAAWYTSGEVVLFAGDVGGLAEDTVATIRRALPYEHRRGAIRVWSAVP